MKWLNMGFTALPVTFHLRKDRTFLWQRITGIQIGDWFIGVIKGHYANEYRDTNK